MAIFFQARVTEIEDFPAARLRRLVLSPDNGGQLPVYQAGQYALLSFQGFEPRAYSIGNAPGQPGMEFHIRRAGTGASHYAATELQIGDTVGIDAPYGSCLYVKDCDHPVIAVAGGSGLAGMKAIIEEALADTGRAAPVTLYHGARNFADLYLNDAFRELEETDARFRYVPVVSDEKIDNIAQGWVTDAVVEDVPDLSGYRLYGAGPVDMLRHLEAKALQHGARSDHIHTDLQQHSEMPT